MVLCCSNKLLIYLVCFFWVDSTAHSLTAEKRSDLLYSGPLLNYCRIWSNRILEKKNYESFNNISSIQRKKKYKKYLKDLSKHTPNHDILIINDAPKIKHLNCKRYWHKSNRYAYKSWHRRTFQTGFITHQITIMISQINLMGWTT